MTTVESPVLQTARANEITLANLSILKTGKARAIRFSTLDAICEALSCQPGDILRFESSKQNASDRQWRANEAQAVERPAERESEKEILK